MPRTEDFRSYALRRIWAAFDKQSEDNLRRHQQHNNQQSHSRFKMGEVEVKASTWRLVEVGRVVFFSTGPYAGRLAAISEIIDHKRVLVDGPASKPESVVPRHAAPLAHLSLTPIVIAKLPRSAGTAAVKKQWEKSEVESTWAKTGVAQKREKLLRRRALTDFERFKVMRLRKQARFEVRKTVALAKAKA
ncbi:hypothetical protein AMS68_006678 [Peltaster fructicola]|uniref:Large ribosomal subunit protein eL14 domain-containing protein n=1 Tax=Peltaster fructicola TaxID=286661 RepID=A0A6H0Y2L4_9PEZI|nr:hypothetical protein AMS68_006678 [Peltaster fructicola]